MKIKLHVDCYKSVSDYGDGVQTHGAFTLRDAPVTVPFGDTTRQAEMNRVMSFTIFWKFCRIFRLTNRKRQPQYGFLKLMALAIRRKKKIVESTLNVSRISDVFAQGSRAEVPIIGSVDGIS